MVRSAGRILTSPETVNSPVICVSRGSAALTVFTGATRSSRSQTSPGAIGEEIGAHPLANGKQREIGDAVIRPLREIGRRREIEMAAAKRGDVEADRDRVIATDDLDAEHLTQSDVQAVGDHH